MGRSEARVQTRIWAENPEWRALSSSAQRVYLLALSQSNMSLCGIVPYTSRRWASFAADTKPADISAAVTELEEHRFVLVDEDTEELMIRTFIKNDGVLGKSKVVIGMTREWANILSARLRKAVLEGLGSEFRAHADTYWDALSIPFRIGYAAVFTGEHPTPPDSVSNGTKDQANRVSDTPPDTASIPPPYRMAQGIEPPTSNLLPPPPSSVSGKTRKDLLESEARFGLPFDRWEARVTASTDNQPVDQCVSEAVAVLARQDFDDAIQRGDHIRNRGAYFNTLMRTRRENHEDDMRKLFTEKPRSVGTIVQMCGGYDPRANRPLHPVEEVKNNITPLRTGAQA